MSRIFSSNIQFRLWPSKAISLYEVSFDWGYDIDFAFENPPSVVAHFFPGREKSDHFDGIAAQLDEAPATNFGTFLAEHKKGYLEISFLVPHEKFKKFWESVTSVTSSDSEMEIDFQVSRLLEGYKNAKVGLVSDEFFVKIKAKRQTQ